MSDISEKLRRKVFRGPTMEASHTKTLEWEAADEIDRLRAQDDAIRAEFGGKRDGRPTIECVREAFAAKWSEEDTLFEAMLELRTGELRAMVVEAVRLAAENEKLRAENTNLRTVLRNGGYAIQKVAYRMPPPNAYTPELVVIAQGMLGFVYTNELNGNNTALQDKSDDSVATQWQPIEVEPSKTMRVLLFRPAAYHPDWDGADYGISVGYFSNGEWRDQGTNHDAFEYTAPTHWMPLPLPPEDKSDGSGEGKAASEEFERIAQEWYSPGNPSALSDMEPEYRAEVIYDFTRTWNLVIEEASKMVDCRTAIALRSLIKTIDDSPEGKAAIEGEKG